MKREFIFDYTQPHTRVMRSERVNTMLLDWHRAQSMQMDLEVLFLNREMVSAESLERLNFWVKGGGAWRVSGMPWYDAERELMRFLEGEIDEPLRPGPNGAGRWSLPPGRPDST